jgi:hypothetical protein
MRINLSVVVTATSLMVFFGAFAGAAAEPPASWPALAAIAQAGLCSTSSVALPVAPSPVPVQSCGFCDGGDFCPQAGVRCSYLGTCTSGQNHCCNYSCFCDATCTSVSQNGQACAFQVPSCPTCPPRTLCQVSYCGGEGSRCTFNNTCGAGGCCNYDCAPDATCTLPDPLPQNAC